MTEEIDLSELTYGDVQSAVRTTNFGTKEELDDVTVFRWTTDHGIDELQFDGPWSVDQVEVCLWSDSVWDKSNTNTEWSIVDDSLVARTFHTAYSLEIAVEILDGLE